MTEPAIERFYVIGTTGYGLVSGNNAPSTSYAVLDRAYNGREVFTAYVNESRRRSETDDDRRERCEAKARELNAKHEPW